VKYVCTVQEDGPHPGKEEIFPIPDDVIHATFAVRIEVMPEWIGDRNLIFRRIISAGFINSKGECVGKSESLKLTARPEDTAIYQAQFGRISS